MQPTNIAITLRRRSPWEAMDLGVTMLQRWWRQVYPPHSVVAGLVMGGAIATGWIFQLPWLALALVWWLKPVYDRAILHVLSRAVFGELQSTRMVLQSVNQWLWKGLLPGLAIRLIPYDVARSFNLPVRQLEGQSGRDARERRAVLARRARTHAVWLSFACLSIEVLVIFSSIGLLGQLFLPASGAESKSFGEAVFGSGNLGDVIDFHDVFAYAIAVWLFEPFYVAAGFALYLNRRTLLEGWDIEVALRRIAARHAVAVVLFMGLLIALAAPFPAYAQDKNPKQEITKVLEAKEFGYHREFERWRPKKKPDEIKPDPGRNWFGVGYALAKAVEVLLWIAAGALIAYALWWAARMLPRGRALPPEPYRPPAALFGMELAPETLPPDVAAAASALARDGKLREALSLLYRGGLSELVHKRGVQLLASHTEGEAVRLANLPYFASLVQSWQGCAYGQRTPRATDVERLATEYRAAFA